jgi:hypothetical protein
MEASGKRAWRGSRNQRSPNCISVGSFVVVDRNLPFHLLGHTSELAVVDAGDPLGAGGGASIRGIKNLALGLKNRETL